MSFRIKKPRLAMVSVFLLLASQAVPARSQDLAVGLRVGFNGSVIRFQEQNANDQTEIRPGLHAGATASLSLSRFLAVDASLLLSQGGFARRGGRPASLRTFHLELPLAFRLKTPWKVGPHLTMGLAPRLRTGCKLSEVGIVEEAGCDDPVVGHDWKRAEMTGLLGIGVGAKIGQSLLLVDGMLGWGLTDINEDPVPPGWAKSADLRFSVTYLVSVR